MANRQIENTRKSPVSYMVFSAVVISFLISFFVGQNGILRLRNLEGEYDRMMMDNHKVAVENRLLMEEIRSLKQDPAAIEKVAREELNLVSPHDLVLIVPEVDTRKATTR